MRLIQELAIYGMGHLMRSNSLSYFWPISFWTHGLQGCPSSPLKAQHGYWFGITLHWKDTQIHHTATELSSHQVGEDNFKLWASICLCTQGVDSLVYSSEAAPELKEYLIICSSHIVINHHKVDTTCDLTYYLWILLIICQSKII